MSIANYHPFFGMTFKYSGMCRSTEVTAKMTPLRFMLLFSTKTFGFFKQIKKN